MTMIDLEDLKEKALAAGGGRWTTDAEDCGASGVFQNHHVWFDDGDSVAQCFPNIGHLPDSIDDFDVAEHIAAACPATILELIAKIKAMQAMLDQNVKVRERLRIAETRLLNANSTISRLQRQKL